MQPAAMQTKSMFSIGRTVSTASGKRNTAILHKPPVSTFNAAFRAASCGLGTDGLRDGTVIKFTGSVQSARKLPYQFSWQIQSLSATASSLPAFRIGMFSFWSNQLQLRRSLRDHVVDICACDLLEDSAIKVGRLMFMRLRPALRNSDAGASTSFIHVMDNR
jgi:hypothetical protein